MSLQLINKYKIIKKQRLKLEQAAKDYRAKELCILKQLREPPKFQSGFYEIDGVPTEVNVYGDSIRFEKINIRKLS